MSRRRRPGYVRRLGNSNRPLRRELSSTLAVGWSSTSGTWPTERGRKLERTVRKSRVELEAVAANTAQQLVAQGNAAFRTARSGLRQTVREEFDGYRAHLAMEMQEDIPAHVEARISDVCDFFRGQFNEGAPAGWNSMPASTVKCLQWHCARRRTAS